MREKSELESHEDEPLDEKFGPPEDLFTNPEKYEAELPSWKRTVGLVKQYRNTKPNKREILLDQFSQPIIKNPSTLGQLIDNFALIAELKQGMDVSEIKDRLLNRIEAVAARSSNLSTWSPQRIEELIKLGLESSGEVKTVAERIEKALFNTPKTIEEAVALHYNAATAMIATTQPEVREEIFSILCLERECLPAQSLSAQLFGFGMGTPSDETLGRYHAVMDAIDFSGILIETQASKSTDPGVYVDSRRAWNRVHRIQNALTNLSPSTLSKIQSYIINYRQKYSERAKAISQYYDNEGNQSPIQASGKTYLDSAETIDSYLNKQNHLMWPESVITNSNEPLRRLVFETLGPCIFRAQWENLVLHMAEKGFGQVTTEGINISSSHTLEVIAKGYNTTEQKNNLIREIYYTLQTGNSINPQRELMAPMDKVLSSVANREPQSFGFWQTFDKDQTIMFALCRSFEQEQVGKLSSILKYHRPLLNSELIGIMENKIKSVKTELLTDFKHAVTKRGYTLTIADPALRRLGYNSITYKLASKDNTDVVISIDKQEYIITLGNDYQIVPGKDIKRFTSSQDQAWLELLVLSHLKKLVCIEEDEEKLKPELVGEAKQYEHYRKQAPGPKYSPTAFELCLKSHLPVKNLYRINIMKAEIGKGGTLETGIWTYVSGTEWIDNGNLKPVKVAYKNAADDLREVIPLGDISPEELARIEKEILDEFEI